LVFLIKRSLNIKPIFYFFNVSEKGKTSTHTIAYRIRIYYSVTNRTDRHKSAF
jgi:hypothetical protein